MKLEKEPSSQIDTDATSTAKFHDSREKDNLLSGDEQAVFGDSAYGNKEDKRKARKNGVYYDMIDKATRSKKLSKAQKKKNLKNAKIRVKVETRLLL